MRSKYMFAATLSPYALAVVVLAACSFAGQSAEAQSSQPPFPALWQRPDLTAPLEDNSVQAADETAIRNLETRQQEAWNHHDAKAYASLSTEDGEVVNVVGWWWKGPRRWRTNSLVPTVFVFRDSTLNITEVHIRFLAPDTAIAHVLWTLAGARTCASKMHPAADSQEASRRVADRLFPKHQQRA